MPLIVGTGSLQTGAGFVHFAKTQLGARVPSTMVVAPMSERFIAALDPGKGK